MDQIAKVTRLARLLVAPPDVVYTELKSYSADVQASWMAASSELEASLAARGDPLIDLAIASFGVDKYVLGNLYRRSKTTAHDEHDRLYKQGIRVAILANETANRHFGLDQFPKSIIGEEELAYIISSGDWIEAEALILNPSISNEVLICLYTKSDFCASIDDDRHRSLVFASSRNKRLQPQFDHEYGIYDADFEIHSAIFQMLATVPTTDPWIRCLTYFLTQLDPDHVSREHNIDAVLERWVVDKDSGEIGPKHYRDTDTGLPERTEFRCLIAALYGKGYNKSFTREVIHGTADAETVERRCAYYGNAELDFDDIRNGYEKDGRVFLFAVMTNKSVWGVTEKRKLLEECLDGIEISNFYWQACERINSRHKWFDPTMNWSSNDDARTREKELQQVAEKRQIRNQQRLEILTNQIGAINQTVKILCWLILALGLATLWRS